MCSRRNDSPLLSIRSAFGGPQGGDNPGKPSPQVGQGLADVVAAGAEDGEEGIPEGAFQGTSGKAAVGFSWQCYKRAT